MLPLLYTSKTDVSELVELVGKDPPPIGGTRSPPINESAAEIAVVTLAGTVAPEAAFSLAAIS